MVSFPTPTLHLSPPLGLLRLSSTLTPQRACRPTGEGLGPTRLSPLQMPVASGVCRLPTLLPTINSGSSHDPFSFDNLLECPPEPKKGLKPIPWFIIKDKDGQPDEKGYSVRSGRVLGYSSSCPLCLAGTPQP